LDIHSFITIDAEIQGGQPVFKGTRVPIETLFNHLGAGVSLDEFLNDFSTVSKDQAIGVLDIANRLLSYNNLLAKFLRDEARDKADAIWDQKGYTDEQLQQILD